MGKYKICVYAISKNEEKYAEKWFNSMKEADEIYVLDTGSTDNTVNILKNLGAHVETKIISPWRFDVARNESLKLVPDDTDIYICTDLDELFLPGWRKELEEKWQKDTVQAKYQYNWLLDKYNNPRVTFLYDKIHNKDFEWLYPVHEVLIYKQNIKKNFITLNTVTLNHYQDRTKNRSNYLPLLNLALDERPNDTRLLYLLARQHLTLKHYEECIKYGTKYMEVGQNCYYTQKSATCRFIARSNKNLGNIKEAKEWYRKAIKIAPNLREPYVEFGMLEFDQYNYGNAIYLLEYALTIKKDSPNNVNEIFAWNDKIYILLSKAYSYTNRLEQALNYIEEAIKINPDNEESQNLKIALETLKNYT